MSKALKKLIDINRLREFKNKLNAQHVLESLPVGVIIPFAGTSVPTGYLLCNGAAVSRTDYANLFAAIGTRYGAGNGCRAHQERILWAVTLRLGYRT